MDFGKDLSVQKRGSRKLFVVVDAGKTKIPRHTDKPAPMFKHHRAPNLIAMERAPSEDAINVLRMSCK